MALFCALGGLLRLIDVTIEGEPLKKSPVVYVANHPSFFDAILLIPLLPRTACLYKSGLEETFPPRSLAESAGFISNAGSIESIRQGVARLQAGWCILLFPEGTRTTVPPMGQWKSSYALMATRASAPVQPIFIRMTPPLFHKGASWWRPPEFPRPGVDPVWRATPPATGGQRAPLPPHDGELLPRPASPGCAALLKPLERVGG